MGLFGKKKKVKDEKPAKAAENQNNGASAAQKNEAPDWRAIFEQIFRKNLELLKDENFSAEEMNEQFADTEKYHVGKIGEVNVVSGQIEMSDPLCYINTKYGTVPERTIEPGVYPVLISRMVHPVFGMRHLTAKLQVTEQKAVRYELAVSKDGVFSGFGVDTGTACFCDRQTAALAERFLKEWHEKHPGKNHYDDYFRALFEESAGKEPQYQRKEGSYLDWTVPGTDNHVVMFNSGFGDGLYEAYWGLDAQDEICCLAIRMIDPKCFDVPMPEIKIKPRKAFKLSAEEIKPLLNKKYGWCLATDRITVDGCKVGYLYREKSEREGDSGWRFFEGTEEEAYLDNPDNTGIYDVNTIANYDTDIIPLLDAPAGKAFFRAEDGKLYEDRQ